MTDTGESANATQIDYWNLTAGPVWVRLQEQLDHQIGGIFIGGNATALLKDRSLAAVQAVARVPVGVAVEEEGGRAQRTVQLAE